MEVEAQLWILLDIFVAAILGGLVGFEREWMRKPAGLRTNMIIAGSSALFVSLGRVIVMDFKQLLVPEGMGMDPIRMLHAVLVGVSVIGAGTILKQRRGDYVKFLTTAATILMASAIGIAVALKQYWLGAGSTALILLVNLIFSYVGDFVAKKSGHWRKGAPPETEHDKDPNPSPDNIEDRMSNRKNV